MLDASLGTNIKISHPTKKVNGTIRLTGSKSISNRALIIQALCKKDFEIENLSDSIDTQTLIQLLASKDIELNAGHAGTTYRFMTAYCAVTGREAILSGSDRMHQRPIGELVEALNSIGAEINYKGEKGLPPLEIKEGKITGEWVRLKADISSQYITALLLVAPTLPKGLKIELESEPVSRPYIEMTLRMMEYFGIQYHWEELTIHIDPQEYIAKDYFVESDWSSASYLYSIAAIANSADIIIEGLTDQKLQGDSAISNMMTSFGISTSYNDKSIHIKKIHNDTVPFYEYNFISQPDIAQTVSVIGAAKGSSLLMSGLQTLAIKETDRTKALKQELKKFSVSFVKMPNRFSQKSNVQYFMQEGIAESEMIEEIETYNDHRMAMAFAPLSMRFPIIIKDKEVVHKSYPTYWDDLTQLGFIIPILISCLLSISISAQEWTLKIEQPTELGQVHWLRDYDSALRQSAEKGLPVFMFFQEVPGCHTCTKFGNQVMSHPLIVEAIETHFVPLVIYNNKGGDDAKVLKKYNEPSWNNPVVRIINSKGKDIVKRHSGAYNPVEVVSTIQNALLASNQITPTYLQLLQEELSDNTEEAVLSMYCFWTGEREIGSMRGVKSTQAGYMNGTEVVKVRYNPTEISYDELINKSSEKKCADRVYTDKKDEKKIAKKRNISTQGINTYRVDHEDKYYLSQPDFQNIPMLASQATKANVLIGQRQNPADILSPRQLAILDLVKEGKVKKSNRAKKNILEEWAAIVVKK